MFSVIVHLLEVRHMRYARIALLSAAATCLLPFATPAIAQGLTNPSALVQSRERLPRSAPLRRPHHTLRGMGVHPGATALAPQTNVTGSPLANGRCQVEARLLPGTPNYPEYITTCL
jgi:hypothetical protein